MKPFKKKVISITLKILILLSRSGIKKTLSVMEKNQIGNLRHLRLRSFKVIL